MIKSISKQDLQKIPQNKLRLIDIRTTDEYEKLHIPAVKNIPAEDLGKHLSTFNEGDVIVTICNYGKERSQKAAEFLSRSGFKNAFYLEGGTNGWFDKEA